VGHRLALDEPSAVTRLAVLDIVPTRHVFRHADAAFGLGYYHWFFLAAGNGIPERLLGGDPEFWIRARMGSRHAGGESFDEAAVREYVRCFSELRGPRLRRAVGVAGLRLGRARPPGAQ
jgi:haloacetate dehalogenase